MVAYNLRDGGLVAKSYPTLVTPWTVACQALLSMGFSRQEYWSGLPFPSPGDPPNSGVSSLCLQMRQIFVNTNFKALPWCPKGCR